MKQVPIPNESRIHCIREVFKIGLIEHWELKIQKYGDIFYDKLSPKKLTLYDISHPNFVKYIFHDNGKNYFHKNSLGYRFVRPFVGEGMVTTHSYETWRKDRDISAPAFYLPALKNHASRIVQNCLEMLKNFETAAENQKSINLPQSFTELAMYNVITTIFQNVNIDYKEFNQAVRDALEQCYYRLFSLTQLPWILPTKRKYKLQNALKIANSIVGRVLRERLQQSDQGNDLLGRFIKGYANEPDLEKAEKQICDEIMTFVFAGHETIAATLSWTLVMLSKHPEVERRVRHEIDSVLNGRLATYDDLKSLPYSRAVLSEVLRLYPVLPFISRTCKHEDDLLGYRIPAKVEILINIYHVHRHPDFWENPEGFDPDRFIKNPWYNHQQFAFIPGSAGERHCIGINYALMEGQLSLVTMLQRYKLSLLPGATIKPTYYLTLWPGGGTNMVVKKI